MLDIYPPELSLQPRGAALPPIVVEESLKVVRRLYVKFKDLDPASGGIGAI